MSDNEACDNGYEDIDEEEYNAVEEYQEAEGDVCVQDDYFEEPELADEEQETINTEEEEEVQVQIHGEDDIVFSQETEAHDAVAAENEEVSQDEEEPQDGEESQGDHGEKDPADQDDKDGETEKQEDKEEEGKEEKEEEVVCTFTEEEILAEYKILDGYQREIDEEHYTLRKLRSIIGHQSDNIERMRKKIADYTKNAQDRKAMDAMDALKTMKADRERAVEERSISTETLADVRGKRSERVAELKTKGLKIPSSSSYLIEDTQLKTLYSDIRSILKYNSFAVLKHGIDELDEVIFSVANICDDIDVCLTTRNLKPRDINKLNTKDRRVSVLYDKLLKWRLYKVADPDIRPTDYESFMYDPDDMFSDSEEEKDDKRESRREGSRPKREIRAVRGGDTPPRSRDKTHKRTKNLFQSAHSPIRPPTPPPAEEKSPAPRASKSASPPARAATKSKSPARPAIVRRAVRGGSPDTEERSKERPLRAERGADTAGPRRDQPIRKRRAEPMESDSYKRRQQFSPPRRQAMRRSPVRKERHHSPRDDRRLSPPRNRGGPPRRDNRGRGARTTLLSTPPIKPAHSFDARRSPSPPFRNRNRENFQISVRNETYRPRSPGRHDQQRGFRDDQRGPMMRDERPMQQQQQQHRSPGGYRGRGRGTGPPGGRRQDDRRTGGTYRR